MTTGSSLLTGGGTTLRQAAGQVVPRRVLTDPNGPDASAGMGAQDHLLAAGDVDLHVTCNLRTDADEGLTTKGVKGHRAMTIVVFRLSL